VRPGAAAGVGRVLARRLVVLLAAAMIQLAVAP
jgi:hypothetical protein